MKISKQSWHYRWMKKLGWRHPNNLCKYFWMTVWSGLFFPVVVTAGIATASVLTFPLWWWMFSGPDAFAFATMIGGFEIIALLIAWLEHRRGNYVYKPPGVVKEYLAAKKEKVCPLIEYVQ